MRRTTLLLPLTLLAIAGLAPAKEPGRPCAPDDVIIEPATDDPPSDGLLNTLGVLRRPATEADAFPDPLPDRLVGGIYRNHIRQGAVGPSGERVFLLPARHVQIGFPANCPGTRLYRRGQQEGVAVAIAWPFSAPPDWTGTRPASGFSISAYHPFPTARIVRGDRHLVGPELNPATAYDVLPDGVAKVTYVWSGRKRDAKGRRARRRTVTTVAVTDNIAVITRLPRRITTRHPELQIWLDADGRVLNRIGAKRR